MTKRLLFALLTLCMALVLLPGTALAAATLLGEIPPSIPTTGDVWDGSIEEPAKLVEWDYTYYEITKCSQLAYVAQVGGKWLGYNYTLENNLILNDGTFDGEGNCDNSGGLLEWTPIGSSSQAFTGKFLGNGYAISGLYINKPAEDKVGLFGCSNGTVNGVCIVNSYICGRDYVGGLAGYTDYGTFSDCSVSGFVKGTNCVGGLIGKSESWKPIDNLVNHADVYGESEVAGIAGYLMSDAVIARAELQVPAMLSIVKTTAILREQTMWAA